MATFPAKTKTGCPADSRFSGQTEHPWTYIFLALLSLCGKLIYAGESTYLKVKMAAGFDEQNELKKKACTSGK